MGKVAVPPPVPVATEIAGVRWVPLTAHRDDRGSFTEIFRQEWPLGIAPVQWNLAHSRAGVLRGVHIHQFHTDFLLMAAGEMLVGLRDLRGDSPTAGRTALVSLGTREMGAIVIPPGVAHGFYFAAPATHLYAVDRYWDSDDELGCRWDDPDLGIAWPMREAQISPRDAALPSLSALLAAHPQWRV